MATEALAKPGHPDNLYAEMAAASSTAERCGSAIAARVVREGLNRHEAQAALAFARARLDCWFDQRGRRGNG